MENADRMQFDEATRNVILACQEAVVACEWCERVCISDGAPGTVVRACRDVADLCALSARFIARHAALSPELSEVAAKAARICENECAREEEGHFQHCAQACRYAADLLEEVVA